MASEYWQEQLGRNYRTLAAWENIDVDFVLVRETSKLPTYGSEEAAGMDLYADLADTVTLYPDQRILVPAGFKMKLPRGYEACIRPRSGLSSKHKVDAITGTLDSDYVGEVHVQLHNYSDKQLPITPGERIAQMVVGPVSRVKARLTDKLGETVRGESGFGASGRF